ncbi:MAG: endonuclease domain-containing protein [Devosia sp.]
MEFPGVEKDVQPVTPVGEPSPLAGEGARRADEGAATNRDVESSPRTMTFAKTLRRNQTDAEQRMWRLLRDRRLDGFKFRRQVPVGPYIADFLCFDARLIVELDGSQHADSRRDKVRDRWLMDDGYRVLRIWNNELSGNRSGVLESVWSALQASKTPSSVSAARSRLLPRGEKEVPTAGSEHGP